MTRMRIYTAAEEEAIRLDRLLKEWATEGILSEAQLESMGTASQSELRRTNVFLRLVLFLFTLISAAALIGLIFISGLSKAGQQSQGLVILLAGTACYAGAEFAVSQARFYRYGIEEALALLAVGLLCAGLSWLLPRQSFLVALTAAFSSFLIYRRFGFQWAFFNAMSCVPAVSQYCTSSLTEQRFLIASIFALALAMLTRVRRAHHLDYLDDEYSVIEAMLWLGIYLSFNLELISLNPMAIWIGVRAAPAHYPEVFHWITFLIVWALPVVILRRGLQRRDRPVAGAGTILAVVTLATNKAYLGLPRQTWDPMLLGILLAAIAIVLRRWLVAGPGGIRRGFTAERMSARDERWMSAAAGVSGLLSSGASFGHGASPGNGAPTPAADARFGGGTSAGGGASSDF